MLRTCGLTVGRGILGFFTLIVLAPIAGASTIDLSNTSSDLTPASQLDAVLEFEVGEFDGGNAGDELRLTLTNPDGGAGGDALFNITAIYWNAESNVTALTLLSATHSDAGDVFADWAPTETDLNADGFGAFDFALTDGVGETNVAIVEPGESIVFILDIDGIGVAMEDFVSENDMGYLAAAKFTNGPPDPEAPEDEDSAFGGTVPEPGSGLLLAFGVIALARASRRR